MGILYAPTHGSSYTRPMGVSTASTPNLQYPNLQGRIDSDWVGDLDSQQPTSAYVFVLGGGLILWQSHKQPTHALSSTESEYTVAAVVTKESQ